MKWINGMIKWFAALMFTLAAGLLAIILLSNRPEVSPLLLRLGVVAAISVICSLLLRIFFHRGIAFLVILLGFFTMVFSTLVIDHFYDTEYTLSFLTDSFQLQIPTLQDAAQLVLLLIISLPFLLLFKKKRVKKQQVIEPKTRKPAKPSGPSFSDRVKVAAYQINPKNWKIKLPDFSTKNKKTTSKSSAQSSQPKVHIASRAKTNGSKPKVKAVAAKASADKKLKLPKFGTKAVNNDVKLMGDEEHVCPYCLEVVEKNDPNGIAVCKECHTWHHQDCWDVTGACGVAHRNKL
jgi:ribosomal protein L37AE/L43A